MGARKYFKFDEVNQFLNDEADINYFATNQVRRVAVGNMLGDFNEQGFYVLDKNVITELINMPKIIVDSVGGADLIRSAIKFDSYIHFMLTFEEDKASLILLEKINFESNAKYNTGSYSNMNEYVLEQVNIPDKDVDRNVVYTKYNIVRADEGKYYEYNDLTQEELLSFENIINKIRYNLIVQNLLLSKEKEIETIEADYIDNVLKIFEAYPKLKKEFEAIFKQLIVNKQNFFLIDRPFFAKTVTELLDNCLSAFLKKLPPELKEEIEKKIREAKAAYYNAYNLLIHLQFINNSNVQKQVTDNMIGEFANSLTKEEPRVTRYEINDQEIEKSFYSILEENFKLKKVKSLENSGEDVIRLDNPVLSKLFDEIKKEYGVDLLKNKEQVVKKIEQAIETVKQEQKQEQKEEKQEEKKPAVKPEEKKPEVKKEESKKVDKKPEVKTEEKRVEKKPEPKKTEALMSANATPKPALENIASKNSKSVSASSLIKRFSAEASYTEPTKPATTKNIDEELIKTVDSEDYEDILGR